MRYRFDEQLELLNSELISMGSLCEEAISADRSVLSLSTTRISPESPLDFIYSLACSMQNAIFSSSFKHGKRIVSSDIRDHRLSIGGFNEFQNDETYRHNRGSLGSISEKVMDVGMIVQNQEPDIRNQADYHKQRNI